MRRAYLVLGLILLTLAGCCRKTAAPPVVSVHDTLWTSRYEMDTVYTDRWHYVDRKGDTVWRRDSVIVYQSRVIRDTVRQREEVPVVVETPVEVERHLTFGQQLLIRAGWVTLAAVAALLLYGAFRLWRRR